MDAENDDLTHGSAAASAKPYDAKSYFVEASLGRTPDAALSAYLDDLSQQARRGVITEAQMAYEVISMQNNSTAVALQTYQFFTGKTPDNRPGQSGLAWLVHSPDNDRDLSDAYYEAFNQESRFINFAVNLGVTSSHAAAFKAAYGALSVEATIGKAYNTIIGDHVARFHDVDVEAARAYFARAENISFLNRLSQGSADAELFVKAALVGQIMSAGTATMWGAYSEASNAYIRHTIYGMAAEPVHLVGMFGPQVDPGVGPPI